MRDLHAAKFTLAILPISVFVVIAGRGAPQPPRSEYPVIHDTCIIRLAVVGKGKRALETTCSFVGCLTAGSFRCRVEG